MSLWTFIDLSCWLLKKIPKESKGKMDSKSIANLGKIDRLAMWLTLMLCVTLSPNNIRCYKTHPTSI